MPLKYKYDSGKNVVYTYAIGEVSYEELKKHFQTIFNDTEINNDFWEIVNTANLTNVTFTFSNCMKLIPLIKGFVKEKRYIGALLYVPNKQPNSVVKLLVTMLRQFSSEKYFIENNLDNFKLLVQQQLDIDYEFKIWHEEKNT